MTDQEIDDLYPDVAEFWATPPRRPRASPPDLRLAEEARAALRAVDAELAAERASAERAISPEHTASADRTSADRTSADRTSAERASPERAAAPRVACLACGAGMEPALDEWRVCPACRRDVGNAIAQINARLDALDAADAAALAAWEARLDALDANARERWLTAVAALQAAERRLRDALARQRRGETRDVLAARIEVERWRQKFTKTRENVNNPLSRIVIEYDAHLAALRARQEERAALLSARAMLEDEIPF